MLSFPIPSINIHPEMLPTHLDHVTNWKLRPKPPQRWGLPYADRSKWSKITLIHDRKKSGVKSIQPYVFFQFEVKRESWGWIKLPIIIHSLDASKFHQSFKLLKDPEEENRSLPNFQPTSNFWGLLHVKNFRLSY